MYARTGVTMIPGERGRCHAGEFDIGAVEEGLEADRPMALATKKRCCKGNPNRN
jgi:hypothetical protein